MGTRRQKRFHRPRLLDDARRAGATHSITPSIVPSAPRFADLGQRPASSVFGHRCAEFQLSCNVVLEYKISDAPPLAPTSVIPSRTVFVPPSRTFRLATMSTPAAAAVTGFASHAPFQALLAAVEVAILREKNLELLTRTTAMLEAWKKRTREQAEDEEERERANGVPSKRVRVEAEKGVGLDIVGWANDVANAYKNGEVSGGGSLALQTLLIK